jgi:uncharacterized protein with ParB-like and HNH nuclease domain
MDQEFAMPEVKPEVVFIYQLIRDVVAGKVRIPRFQRPFIWRREQMLDLLDSIRLQYPIGSLHGDDYPSRVEGCYRVCTVLNRILEKFAQ